MKQTTRLSCPLCLRAFEAPEMVAVKLAHHTIAPDTMTALCQDCCAAVFEACAERVAADNAQAAGAEQAQDRPLTDALIEDRFEKPE